MNRRTLLIPVLVLLLASVATATAPAPPAALPPVSAADPTFAEEVDLAELGTIAVHSEGRLKSFDSFAASMMRFVSGPHRINGQSPSFTYLDLMLRPHLYEDADIIYVKKKPIRVQIAQALRESPHVPRDDAFQQRLDGFIETGLISPRLMMTPEVNDLLERLSADLIRTAKFVEMIDSALTVSESRVLLTSWRIIPPAKGGADAQWLSLDQVTPAHAGMSPGGLPSETAQRLFGIWERLMNSWVRQDAAGVNAAADELAAYVATINRELYPDQSRLRWEAFYFRARNLTWIWIFYALSLVPLLLNTVFRWRAARWVGLGLFILAFAAHTGAIMLRWYVAQRWPNTNMFEAVTTAAWFGGVAALILEVLVRHTRMRNVFAIASATASMVALMCVHFLPLHLDAGIQNRMPVLHDVWLYIHTNVIIFSYCLIFMSAVTATLYLLHRGRKLFTGESGLSDFARVGGAGSLILPTPGGGSVVAAERSSIGAVLDGTTMVLLELGFIMLWAGLVMGAIWADHSWGRPWGWDPKEVFALNTFLVLAVLIHVRMKVRDKGLWTAVLALFGAGVMLFNWIAINFVITGLHSYA